MENKLKYIFSFLFVTTMLVLSSCNATTEDSAFYYSGNTGLGDSGNGDDCCCGGGSDRSLESSTAISYCEPEVPELAVCEDGTITIEVGDGLMFMTSAEPACQPQGLYQAASGGVMHLSGRELLNSENKKYCG